MSLIVRHRDIEQAPAGRLEERATLPYSFSEWIRARLGGSSATVESSSDIDVALGHPVVYRSVSKIAGIVAQLPWDARIGRAEVMPKSPLLLAPAPGVLRLSAWKRAATTSMLLSGGAYGLVTESDRRRRIDLLDPRRVDWTKADGWTLDNNPVEEWPAGPLWQVPYATIAGSPKGLNPLEYARRTTFAGLAAAEFGSNFFRDGGHPTAIVAPESDPGEEGARALKQRVMEATSGTNREPIILPQSVKWTQMQINPDDSQFIELMRFSGAELAGFFGLMPEHVGLPSDSGLQYSNRENRQQDLLQDAIMPVVLPLEEALTELLPDGQVVKFNVDGLLRADLKGRYDSYKIAADIEAATGEPLLTVDEMRDFENLDKRPPQADDTSTGTARELAEIVQKVYLGVGVVLTADEARQIINDAGGSLPPGFSPKEP